jgi:hypothetical protein
LLLLAAALLFVIVMSIVLLPLSLLQRYRVGTTRRAARGWLVAVNLAALSVSIVMFLGTAALTNAWVPEAFRYSLMGLVTGGVLGVLGLLLTRWEVGARSLHYTPNRWLVLGITLVVTVRILYGFWRGWHAWRSAYEHTAVIAATGVAGSLAAGGVVLGYYGIYWAGVRRQMRRQRAN